MPERFVDQPREPRDEEQLDRGALEAYLREHLEGFAGPIEIKQFPAGHSNLTYWVGDGAREWVLRRPPFGSQVKTAHDMGREYRILAGLHRAYRAAPRAHLYCDDCEVIGAPFYVMERVRGVILRRDPPKGLVLNEETASALCQSLVDNLVRIHQVDLEVAGLTGLGHPTGYIARQVTGWTERYASSQTDPIAEVEEVARWLADRMPDEDDGALIHNDYKFDNLVLDRSDLTRVVGVLDWEMATVGHPLMDLGTALSYWIESADPAPFKAFRFVPTTLPGMFSRAELVERYAAASGRNIDAMDFFTVFGLFKTAVVAQQIYYRFKTGKTSDRRFAIFIEAVRLLSQRAAGIAGASGL